MYLRIESEKYRGKCNWKQPCVLSTLKSRSIYGVTLWNGSEKEIKLSKNVAEFKNKYKQYIFDGYKNESDLIKLCIIYFVCWLTLWVFRCAVV